MICRLFQGLGLFQRRYVGGTRAGGHDAGRSLTAYPIRAEEDYRARLDDTVGPVGAAVTSHYPGARCRTPRFRKA